MIENIEQQRGPLSEPVDDYTLQTLNGARSLRDLFGSKRDLLIIHNMGRACHYCTMWADGLNGMLPHLEDRCSVALASPDDPQTQKAFAENRGWKFTIVSTQGSSFSADMGFEPQPGRPWPGVSAFQLREDGTIIRTGKASFGPGDQFNAAWHLFALLGDGANGWSPKPAY